MQYRIGVDLGGTNMAAGLVDESWHIVHRISRKTRQKGTPEQIAQDMAELMQDLCGEAGIKEKQAVLAGIGIPGSVTEDGIVEDANNIGFYQVPFKEMLERLTCWKVELVNDARAAAIGEYLAGAGKGSKSFYMLTIGTGIGGAYIVDGVPIGGCNGAAGEIGHMVIRQDGISCNCGRKGCLEAYASASALRNRMQSLVSEKKSGSLWQMCGGKPELLNGKSLFKALELKDELAESLFLEYIEYLAEGAANLINILQPEVLCIGGGMSEQKEKLLVPLRRSVSEKIYSKHSKKQTKLMAAELGNDAGIIGAAYGSGK